MNNPLGVSPSKGIREPYEVKKKIFDLGGNRTNDLRIRSTVTLPTELRGRTELVGDDLNFASGVGLVAAMYAHFSRRSPAEFHRNGQRSRPWNRV